VKVLIDLLRWGEGGTQTFAKRVFPQLLDRLPEAVLLARADVAREVFTGEEQLRRVVQAPPSVDNPYRRHLFQRDRVPGILKSHAVDVYFVPGELSGFRRNSVPRVRVVKMFRNMLPIDDVERRRFSFLHDLSTRVRLELLRRHVLASLATAERVIFVSKHSHEVVASQTTIRDHRVVYHPVPNLPVSPEFATQSPTNSERTILYVSPTDPYKRQLEVIRGFVEYRRLHGDPLARLLLVGPIRGHYGRETRRAAHRVGGAVSVVGAMPHSEILALMQRADLLLFASTCECCPNVLLEYLAAGRPIVCSDVAPMAEFAGDAAVYFNPLDPDDLARALHRVQSDSAVSSALIAAAESRVKLFPLTSTVAGIVEALTAW
jgi:glycosyltransferase involved in cell wall biosynthesis